MSRPRRIYTPPQLAEEWGSTPETVLARIKSGDLQAFTLSPPTAKRPRWKITAEAVEEFERLHGPQVRPKPSPGRSRKATPEYTEYV